MVNEAVETSGSAPVAAPTRGWRRRVFRLIWVIVTPLIILGLLEGALRLAGVGYPTGYFLRLPKQEAYTSNPRFAWRFFPRRLSREPRPIHLPGEKNEDVYRIFVLGGSAAQGIPEPSFSFSRILEAMLTDAYPGTTFEVYNVAMTAINSHVVLPIARDCAEFEPDLYIVYMGNNEVRGPFGVGTAYQSFSPSLRTIRASLAVKTTRLGQLMMRLTSGDSSGPKEWRGMEMNLSKAVPADAPRLAQLFEHFRTNVADICQAAIDADADVLLCTVGVNLKDCPPFGSRHREGLSDADLAAWDQAFQAGRQAEQTRQWPAAIQHYGRAAAIDDRYAQLQFQLGRCYLASGDLEQAQVAFALARDLDVLRFRTDSRLNAILRDVAMQMNRQGVYLVDGERVFSHVAQTPGLPGADLLYEHVHMTFEGNYHLAQAMFDRIATSKLMKGQTPSMPQALTASECAERLMLTPWKHQAMLLYTTMMMSRPPFEDQEGNDQRIAVWEAQAAELKSLITPEKAEQVRQDYLAALGRRPGDVEMRYDFAQFLLNAMDRYEEAERQLRDLHNQLPTVSRYVFSLGVAIRAQGRPGEAELAFEQAVDLSPRPAEIAAKAAEVYYLNDMPTEALAWAEKALAIEPDVGTALQIAGDIYLQQQRYDLAGEAIDAYLQQDPRLSPRELATLYCRLALCLNRTGRGDEQLEPINRAIELDDSFALPYVLLAQVHAGLGADAEAAAAYRRAVTLNATSATLRAELAMLLATSSDRAVRDVEAALAEAREAIRLSNEADPTAWHAMAVAYAENGQFELAVETIDKAITMADGRTDLAAWRRHRQLFAEGRAISQRSGDARQEN